MPIFKIEPIELKAECGDTVFITGINPIRTSPLCGYIQSADGERHDGRWNLKGGGSYPQLSITEATRDTYEFETLIEAAFHLMPLRVREGATLPDHLAAQRGMT